MQQNNYTTFSIQFKGLELKKSYFSENNTIIAEYDRIDKREMCCGNLPNIHDYRTVTIKHNPYMGYIVRLKVKKQRYKCLICKKIKTSNLDMIKPKCRIADTVFKEFEIQIKKIRTIKEISTSLGISFSRGYIYFESMQIKKSSKENITTVYMDEFKDNSNNEKYQLAIYNQNRELVDILENRKSPKIKEWFKVNDIKPNIFVTDMFMQFRNVINTTFDNPIIVADKYHVLRQSDWMLRDVRIRLFNSDVKYKELKKYWKLLAKSPTSKYSKKQKYRLNKLFELSSELKGIFNFRKKFYYLFKAKNDIKFKKGIESLIVDLDKSKITEAKRLSDTLENWKEEIINAYVYNINNGFVEGYNNKIKVIKRVSFGIKKFKNLEKLIHLRIG